VCVVGRCHSSAPARSGYRVPFQGTGASRGLPDRSTEYLECDTIVFSRCVTYAATIGRRVHRAPLVWLHQFFHLFQALRGPLRDDIHRIGLRLACHFR
jgi:hypothetical protein